MNYDYLLFVGPGRSGTTYLYRALKECYAVMFPEIKEGYYYRSADRYTRMRWMVPPTHVLGDGANGAYMDDQLAERVSGLGARTLIVVTLRNHLDRAHSMLKFDLSRGRELWHGKEGLESRVIDRRLTPAHLERIYSTNTDVVVIEFGEILRNPEAVLNYLADLLGIPGADGLPDIGKNPSEGARSVHLSALATLASNALRGAGLRHLLQTLKDSQTIHNLVFKGAAAPTTIGESHSALLVSDNEECWKLIHERSLSLDNGVFIRRRKWE